MTNNLTDRTFWQNYWQNYQYSPIPQKTFFDNYIPKNISGKSFIEIGGFPGTMSIYFHKKYACKATLLDFYIDPNMVHQMETTNQIDEETVECIEHDFFTYQTNRKFDIVFSLGFIEHFENTKDVIARHIQLLSSEGQLLIILPNFLGLNGWIQKTFDRKNFEAHNLSSMNVDNLKKIVSEFNLSEVYIDYIAKPMLWLEPKPTIGNKIARFKVKILSYLLKLFPVKGKFLSPYIIISAKK